jgi:hypothetical protein
VKGVKDQTSHFDIDNFLNAHPMPLKNKKGVSVLAQSKHQKAVTNKYKIPEKAVIKEEESIVLMTLP